MLKINRNRLILLSITLLAGCLRLFRLSRADMITDAAHYSFRAIGYVDYISPNTQTSPIVWFGFRPWWSFLSFHDHPPLVFLIQNIFFKIFGISTFTARLPFALFGIASVILIYFLVKKMYGEIYGYLASFVLAICNFHVWISREGYLESVLIFFILLAIYYFIKALEQDKYFIHFGLFLGISFLCKYTAFFLIPVFLTYLILRRRRVFKGKKIWIGLFLCLIVFSPVIVYNLEMYQTRGHFDMQFAALLNQDFSDWPNIQRKASFDLFGALSGIWTNLQDALSPVIFYLFLISLGFVLFELIFRKKKEHWLIIIILFFLSLFFALTKTSTYFLSVYTPFMIIVLSYALIKWIYLFRQKQRYVLVGLLGVLAGYVVFFTINTNLAYQVKGAAGKTYSNIRLENYGLEQLEKFLNDKIKIKDNSITKIRTIYDLFLIDSQQVLKTNPEVPDVFIYDDNLNWFAQMWYLRRRLVYQKLFFVSAHELLQTKEQRLLESIEENYRNFYFISVDNKALLDSEEYLTPFGKDLEQNLVEEYNLIPFVIKNPKGETAFKIYQFK